MSSTEKAAPSSRPDFMEDTRQPLLDIPLSDSCDLWLIQCPINQLKSDDFHGKEISLNLNNNGALGGIETSSGKSYEFVSFASQKPEASVFVSAGQECHAVGKISRRVCLVRDSEPSELDKYGLSNLNLRSHQSKGSSRKSMSRFTGTALTSQGSTPYSSRKLDLGSSGKKHQREDAMHGSPAAEGSTHTSGSGTTSLGLKKSKKKKAMLPEE